MLANDIIGTIYLRGPSKTIKIDDMRLREWWWDVQFVLDEEYLHGQCIWVKYSDHCNTRETYNATIDAYLKS